MRTVLAALLTSHALIHLLGFLKAFGFAGLPQLTISILKPLGVAWLVAMLALLGAAAALFVAPRAFWLVGAFGILISQLAIVASWSDARFGTVVNLVALLAVVHGASSSGPFGLHAAYQQQVHPSPGGRSTTGPSKARLPTPGIRFAPYSTSTTRPHS
jgi:hypothetical protein